MEAFAEDLASAVEQVKVVTWDAIRRDRFSLTPDGLFEELSRSAAALMSRMDEESIRRNRILEKGPEEADAPDLSSPSAFRKDKYDCDLDRFKQKTGKAPMHWNKTVHQASQIIIEDMRTMLELHYDDVHVQKWRKKNTLTTPNVRQDGVGRTESLRASHKPTEGSSTKTWSCRQV